MFMTMFIPIRTVLLLHTLVPDVVLWSRVLCTLASMAWYIPIFSLLIVCFA